MFKGGKGFSGKSGQLVGREGGEESGCEGSGGRKGASERVGRSW